MTMDELAALGKECLVEFNDRLKDKVHGVKPFDRVLATNIAQKVEWSMSKLQPKEIKPVICSVLERLSEVGKFVMSEPETGFTGNNEWQRNVEHGELRLTFTCGGSAVDLSSHLWISCWCYPFLQPKATVANP